MQEALIDKLCERLAVEDGGVRIYQAVLAKLEGDPGNAEVTRLLTRFQGDEARHRDLLARYLDRLGVSERDTPSARLARLEGDAYLKLIQEAGQPTQVLNILLTIELMDEVAWELLVNLGRDLGDAEMVTAFNGALREEKEHLMKVRGLVARRVRDEVEATA